MPPSIICSTSTLWRCKSRNRRALPQLDRQEPGRIVDAVDNLLTAVIMGSKPLVSMLLRTTEMSLPEKKIMMAQFGSVLLSTSSSTLSSQGPSCICLLYEGVSRPNVKHGWSAKSSLATQWCGVRLAFLIALTGDRTARNKTGRCSIESTG